MDAANIINTIKDQGLLPLFFHPDKETCSNILRALYRAGGRVIEFTNRGAQALDNFRHLRSIVDAELPGMLLGAGTIKTGNQANDFLEAGADFLISPGWNRKVLNVASGKNVLWIPGCMTPSEIMKAEDAGFPIVKLFPGSLLGPGFVSAVKELFPGLLFMPTGGVKLEEENLRAWFDSGVFAVGAGSTLINKKMIESANFEALEQSVRNGLDLISRLRKGS